MMKRIVAALAAAALLVATAVPAAAGYTGKYVVFDEWVDGHEYLALGNNPSGNALVLRGTPLTCGEKGDSYDEVRGVLWRSGKLINWSIDRECDWNFTVRVCVWNIPGDYACTAYLKRGWKENYWFGY